MFKYAGACRRLVFDIVDQLQIDAVPRLVAAAMRLVAAGRIRKIR
jgi:hypothetical protein